MQSHLATSWAAWAPFTPYALRTDLATTTFASLNLTQEGFLWESDDGLNPDQNTTTGSINAMLRGVRRGERLNLRISVSSVSNVSLQSKIFQLQYAATSTNAITTSADCALFATSSPSWVNVGIGATSVNPLLTTTSISPTSVNFSLANSFEQGLAVSAEKLTSGANFQNGHSIENTAQSNLLTLSANKGTELVYAIQTGETMPDAKVCFRLVLEENGDAKNGRIEPLSGYTQYPALAILPYTLNAQRYSKGVQRTNQDTFTDLSSKITWASATVRYLAYDSFNHLIFFAGSGANRLGRYDPASDTFTDL